MPDEQIPDPETPITAANEAMSEPPEQVATPTEPPPDTPASPTPPETDDARRNSAKWRVEQATARQREAEKRQREAEREAEYWRTKAQPATPAAPTDQKPTPDQFATTEDYIEAMSGWKATQIVKSLKQEMVQETAQRTAQEELHATITRFEPLVEAARAKYEDFDEVTSAPVYSPQTQQLIYASPQGAEVAYHLALNPQEADRINRLGVVAAAREIVKLEAQFAPPVPKKISSAPTPIRPVSGGVPVEADPNKMSVEDWMANRRQQLTRKG